MNIIVKNARRHHRARGAVLAALALAAALCAVLVAGCAAANADDDPMLANTGPEATQVWGVLYEQNDNPDGYRLVFQNNEEADSKYGNAVETKQYSFTADGAFAVSKFSLSKDKLAKVHHIEFRDKLIAPRDMSKCFEALKACKTIDLTGLDTSQTEIMYDIFSECESLESIDPSKLDTSNATDMQSMFYRCHALTEIDMSSCDTSKATTMRSLFNECVNLKHVNLRGLDTSNVTSLYRLFYKCESLENADLSSLDTSNVEIMAGMFEGCTAIKSIDLSGFDTSKVNDAKIGKTFGCSTMFADCPNLTSINLTDAIIAEPFYGEGVFTGCDTLTNLALSPSAATVLGQVLLTEMPGKEWPAEDGTVYTTEDIIRMGEEGKSFTNCPVPSGPEPDQPGTSTAPETPAANETSAANGETPNAGAGASAAATAAKPPATKISKLKAAKKSFTVKWAKKSKKQVDGYQVRYSLKKNMKSSKTKTVKGAAKASLTIKKLKAGKKYYVQVRTYKKAGKTTVYSTWSATKTVKVKK